MDDVANATRLDHHAEHLQLNWVFIALAIIPLSCVAGNGLVIAAVGTTKSLQTSTNYLLVSLACADLLIGLFVMPLNIYVSINALHWHLSAEFCYVYCLLDVSASTCSIAHLVLISIDRLIAATKPAEYKTQKHKRRIYIAITSTWIFSICISLPLVTGFNTSTQLVLQQAHHCGIYSPVYMLCSSIFAFYLPCLIMSLTYGYIFRTLRRRLRAIQLQEMAGGQFLGFGADIGNIATSAIETVIGVDAKNRNMITWEKPLLRKIEETAAEHASSLNDSEREQLQTILEAARPSCSSINHSQYEFTATLIEPDELSDRPSSVILEAITLRHTANVISTLSGGAGWSGPTGSDWFQYGAGAQALEVPRNLPRRMTTRRFSDASHFNLSLRLSSAGKMATARAELLSTDDGSTTGDDNFQLLLQGHQKPKHNKAEEPKSRKATLRRHSYQPGTESRLSQTDTNYLRPHRDKAMRQLSDVISEWERPSRSSLGQMYSFARRESVYIARKKLAGLKHWALDLLAKLKSKQGMAIRRETRATKLVATVMGVFLICWLPFFTLNMIKVYRLMKDDWPSDLESLFHWSSALGYLNSSLNFVIYSAINKKFRASFRRLIGLNSHRKRKSWMLPPRELDNDRHRHHGHRHCRHHAQRGKPKDEKADKENKKIVSDDLSPSTGDKAAGPTMAESLARGPQNLAARSSRSSRSGRSGRSNSSNPLSMITRRFSVRKPEIVIDEVSAASEENLSISAGGYTTYRHSSEDCIRRSSSELIGGGISYPSNRYHESRRDSGMSNSSVSLQLHDMHQIADQSSREAEIFV